ATTHASYLTPAKAAAFCRAPPVGAEAAKCWQRCLRSGPALTCGNQHERLSQLDVLSAEVKPHGHAPRTADTGLLSRELYVVRIPFDVQEPTMRIGPPPRLLDIGGKIQHPQRNAGTSDGFAGRIGHALRHVPAAVAGYVSIPTDDRERN